MKGLKFLDIGVFSIREPGRRGIGDNRFNKGVIGGKEIFFLVPPGGTSKTFKDIKAGGNSGGEVLDMGSKGEMGVKGNSKDGGGFI